MVPEFAVNSGRVNSAKERENSEYFTLILGKIFQFFIFKYLSFENYNYLKNTFHR